VRKDYYLDDAKEILMATSTYKSNQTKTIAGEEILRKVVLVIGRLALAYLFFTQLLWKMPPTFGCPPDFAFTSGTVEGGRVQLQRTSGLCDWIGIEVVWSTLPHPFFVANIDNQGKPEIAIDLGWAARLNGLFIENFVMPNIRWFGWVIWGSEAFIFISMLLGLFSRLGGLVAIAMSAQLMIGLGGISTPYEWEWTYNLMVVLAIMLFGLTPGRVLGVDAWLRPRLQAAADKGNRVARWLLWLT
jgi:hypothetical protein